MNKPAIPLFVHQYFKSNLVFSQDGMESKVTLANFILDKVVNDDSSSLATNVFLWLRKKGNLTAFANAIESGYTLSSESLNVESNVDTESTYQGIQAIARMETHWMMPVSDDRNHAYKIINGLLYALNVETKEEIKTQISFNWLYNAEFVDYDPKNKPQYILVSSNENKLKEFQRFGIHNIYIEKGRDIPEVNHPSVDVVAMYKSIEAGKMRIVEDTALFIDGEDVGVNVKWLLDSISKYEGKKATWKVCLAVNDGNRIYLYEGVVYGRIVNNKPIKESFGFDNYFIPDDTSKTLYELEKQGSKDGFSARRKAVNRFLNEMPYLVVPIAAIKPWEGNYQKEKE
ncbi:non-canonical purine NTP pyrophosphatase [Bacillus sp. NPDC094106]|uniref:non-canonical purine NTP pyrophosphatase n=1 Tax=Bacillus sp. NPDC094106 TaxID=3363949 RepID=UPI0037F327F1